LFHIFSSFTNKYIQKSDDLTGVSVSLRSWEEKSKYIFRNYLLLQYQFMPADGARFIHIVNVDTFFMISSIN